MNIALTILCKIPEYLAAPVATELSYVFYFNANIKTLMDKLEKLQDVKVAVQIQVDAATRNVEIINPVVQRWLLDAVKIGEKAQLVIQKAGEFPIGCFNRVCLNLKSCHHLGRDAKKLTNDIIELQQDAKFGKISFPAPFEPVEASSSSMQMGTRKWILDQIIEKLQDEKFNMIGISGMGGVGKTTIAEQVLKRVKEDKLFDEYSMTVISQKADLTKVQSDIAEMLGLGIHEQNPIVRKDKLNRRLKNKRVLIVLDDVWEEFDLSVLGINFQGPQEGCKILFTSREENLWRALKTKIDFPLAVLTEFESWDLFEAKVADSIKGKPELQSLAKEIVKECGGLPLALVTIGSGLVGKSPYSWRDTLRQLKTNYPAKTPGVYAKVYQSIELSYKFLEDEEAKSLFLLCCLFKEDFEIPVEKLVSLATGLRLLEGVIGLKQARDRVFALVEQLESRSLVLPGRNKGYDCNVYIKMHDVIRDVAKSIASVERSALVIENGSDLEVWQENGRLKNLMWISILSKEVSDLPTEMRSPRVKLLRCSRINLQTTASFLEGMKELRVLDVREIIRLISPPPLPSSIRLPRSLRTLYIRDCNLENITTLGDLPNLEILSFEGSHIEELPIEIGSLANLVSINLTGCYGLTIIRPGVILRLCQLQELYIGDIEINWGGNNEKGIIASLGEFRSLSNLHTLHIKIKDPSVLPISQLFSNLKKYAIKIGDWERDNSINAYKKNCSISLRKFVPLEGDIKYFVENADELSLKGEFTKDLVHELVRGGSQSLKRLHLYEIDTIEYLSNATSTLLFSNIESLSLTSLDGLQQMSYSPIMVGSFERLRRFFVTDCSKLKNIFQVSIVTKLVNLERLITISCRSMKEVIWKEREDTTNKLTFPKLEWLQIWDLPSLESFCKGIEEIEFPRLHTLSLKNLPQVECVFSGLSNQSIFPYKVSYPSLEIFKVSNLDEMKEIWCGQLQNGSFRNLTQLIVINCHKLRSVFTPYMARYLVHLQELRILDSSALEVIVANEEEEDGAEYTPILPNLKICYLFDLLALESFCHVTRDLEFPMLDDLHVARCPELKSFSAGSLRTPKLKKAQWDAWGLNEDILGVDNLNIIIGHLHNMTRVAMTITN